LERLLLAPVRKSSLLLGKMLSGVIFGFLMGILFLIISLFIFDLNTNKIIVTLILMFFSATSFASLGMFVASSVREVFEAMTLFNFFRFPMIFICGVFMPLESMPGIIKYIARFLPLTYSVDGLRDSLLNEAGVFSFGFNLFMLIFFTVFFFLLSIFTFKRRLVLEY